MMENKKELFAGLGLLIVFAVILAVIFSPVYKGHNGLEYLDNLYNSISKGSAYYIPKVKKEIQKIAGTSVIATIEMADDGQAKQTAVLLMKGDALVNVSGTRLKIEGDLAKILLNCVADADSMYINDGKTVAAKYGYNERQVLYNWWLALKALNKDLTKQKQFKAASAVDMVATKAVETSYNYYRIEPQKISDRFFIVLFSLVFYVIYTLCYGFAIMFIFEGWGLKLEH
jgi:hypothetical protein